MHILVDVKYERRCTMEMKHILKRGAYALGICLLTLLFVACSLPLLSKTVGDDGNKKGEEEIHAGLTEQFPIDIPEWSRQTVGYGEPIDAVDIQNGQAVSGALVYTLNKATLFADFSEAGLEESAMDPYVPSQLFETPEKNGKLRPSVKFLMIELTVRNVRAYPERSITSLIMLCSDGTETGFFELSPDEIAYFSNPTGKKIGEDWKEYLTYQLPVGQVKNIKVGWYVDTERYDAANLYLVFNYGLPEDRKFVKIDA